LGPARRLHRWHLARIFTWEKVARQIDAKHSSGARLAFYLDSTLALSHDAVDRRKSEPGPFLLLGGEERLERMRKGLWIHPTTGVLHRKHDMITLLDLQFVGAVGQDVDVGGAQTDPTPTRHRI